MERVAEQVVTEIQLGHKKPQPMLNHMALSNAVQDHCVLTLETLNARLDQHAQEMAKISCQLQSPTERKDQRPYFTIPGLMLLGLVIAFASSLYLGVIITEGRIDEIVNKRLLLYSKDQTSLRNYAHPFTSADIITALTSPTYDHSATGGTAWKPKNAISPGLQPG